MGLDTVELIMEVEERFDIAFGDADVEQIGTVGEFCDAIALQLDRQGRVMPRERIFVRVRRILELRYRIPEAQIVMDARIVEDLGLD